MGRITSRREHTIRTSVRTRVGIAVAALLIAPLGIVGAANAAVAGTSIAAPSSAVHLAGNTPWGVGPGGVV